MMAAERGCLTGRTRVLGKLGEGMGTPEIWIILLANCSIILKTPGRVRIRGIAGSVSDQPCLRSVEPALQRASRDRDAAALGKPPPHRLDLRVVVEARRAEAQRGASSPG